MSEHHGQNGYGSYAVEGGTISESPCRLRHFDIIGGWPSILYEQIGSSAPDCFEQRTRAGSKLASWRSSTRRFVEHAEARVGDDVSA